MDADKISAWIGGIIASIVALAVIAVVLSYGSNTVGVIKAFFGGLAGLIGVAVSPTTQSGLAGSAASSILSGPIFGNADGTGSVFGGSTYAPGNVLNSAAGAVNGVSNLASSIDNLSNNSLFGGSGGGGGGGFIDTGSFDLGTG